MAISADDVQLMARLWNRLQSTAAADAQYDAYYEGQQRLEQIGLAVPPELRRFETFVNWPRLVVDAIEERLDVRALTRPGSAEADPALQEGWDANNLDSESGLVHTDALVYGRAFVSVGTNEDDADHPLISVESPTEMSVEIDTRKRRVTAAFRLYGTDDPNDPEPKYATLYLPDRTSWYERDQGRWSEVDRDEHRLGVVPVVPFFNRRRTGRWIGVSEIADGITLTDAAARTLTNLQIAAETHSVPQRYALGISKGDFVDSSGKQLPVWEAYFGSIWATANKDAKVGQFTATDLRNFRDTIELYAALISGLYGLPMRYLGQNTANPPSADGIRADEARLVRRAERKQLQFGDSWGWVGAIYERFRTGQWVDGNRIKTLWHDAATPTYAAKVDAIQKLTGGKPILSVEGGWDELGWNEARKERERAYLEHEATDPVLERIARDLTRTEDATGVDAAGG